jgi:hypothetical protein
LSAQAIHSAAENWLFEHPSSDCPTVNQLVQEKYLGSDKRKAILDPWNQEFTITCAADELIVTSSGPDKQAGTWDDIVAKF